jgi:hypothetical protein
MQVLSQYEVKTVDGGSFLGGLLGVSINLIKKLIPGQKKFPHIINSEVEMGNKKPELV